MLKVLSAFTLVMVLSAASGASAQQVTLGGDVKGANEVPPVQSPASGTAIAIFDPATRNLSWTIAYSGLATAPTAMHFHGPAEPAYNAGVAVMISGDLSSPVKGSATLTESQAADLQAGRWYLNIHTAANPAGELRAQMTVVPAK
jgi:hypothetical protein